MDESVDSAPECAGLPARAISRAYLAIERERQHMALVQKAMYLRIRKEQRARLLQDMFTYWPLALGAVLGIWGPELRVFAAECSPWAATLLFPFSALAERSDLRLPWAVAQSLFTILPYAQFPLDGLLVRLILKRRPTAWNAFGLITCMHVLMALYIAFVSGSFSELLAK